jgi:predicted RNA-binding Zn-ribbon protein involved in translation (DUF1610 family)
MDAKTIIDQVADIQRSGKKTLCPRCGRDSMNEKLARNALSRYARVYICDDCGTDEALRDLYDEVLPLTAWDAVKKVIEP